MLSEVLRRDTLSQAGLRARPKRSRKPTQFGPWLATPSSPSSSRRAWRGASRRSAIKLVGAPRRPSTTRRDAGRPQGWWDTWYEYQLLSPM